MKKLALLLFALVIAVGVQGAELKLARSVNKNHMVVKKEMTTKHKLVKGESPRAHAATGTLRAIISEQPEGEAKTYTRTGDCVYVNGGYIKAGAESGTTTIVFADDNIVYIKDLLYGSGGEFETAWVKGTLSADGTQISIPMGQSIFWSDDYNADVVLAWGASSVEGTSLIFTKDESVTEAVYAVDNEAKTISLLGGNKEAPEGVDYPDYFGTGLGTQWTDDGSHGGFMAFNTVFTEFDASSQPTVITEQPEGELATYYRSGNYIASSFFGVTNGNVDGKVNVVFGNDGKVFIQNPMWWLDNLDSWVEGTYDEESGIIAIPTGQYLSFDTDYMHGDQIGWGSTTVEQNGVDEETGDPTYIMHYEILDADYIYFKVENDKKTITLQNCAGDINAEFPNNYVATGIIGYYSDDMSMTAIEFNDVFQYVDLAPAVPADPTADEWYDCGDESGFSKFYFTLPTTDVDGNPIDPEYLSYSIFTDNDQLFTFPAEDYTFDLTEDITEVSYELFSNAVDFRNFFVYMYRTNAEGFEPLFKNRIGIQVYYTVNGVRNSSNIVYLGGETVESVFVHGVVVDLDEAPIEGVEVVFTPVPATGKNAPSRAEAVEVAALTDSNGYFMADLAADNEYMVTISYSDVTVVMDIVAEGEEVDMGTIVLDVVQTGINELLANKQVASTTYFDMAGRKVSQPVNGVFIKSVRYNDGTVSTMKVVK